MMRRRFLVLLSIIVPLSFLLIFRVANILLGLPLPKTFDTKQVETVSYEVERPPSIYVNIDDTVRNQYNDSVASMFMQAQIAAFYGDFLSYGGYDLVEMRITTMANVTSGFVYSVKIRCPCSSNTATHFWLDSHFVEQYDLNITKVNDYSETDESYIEALGFNKPNDCSLSFPLRWISLDHLRSVQSITFSAEILHFNDSAYRKYVIPIFVKLTEDAGDTIDEASKIIAGFHEGFLGGSPVIDENDYYNITISPPNTFIFLNLTMPLDSDFDLYVYTPDHSLFTKNSTQENGMTKTLSFNAYAGSWYIDVRQGGGLGKYVLTVVTNP